MFYNRSSVAEKLTEVCTLFKLCPRFCGIHRTSGKCNHPIVLDCPGACIGSEMPEEYNGRVGPAIDYLNNSSKNFAIRVKGRKYGESGFVLVRDGTYQGYGYIGMHEKIATLDDFEDYLVRKTHSYHTTRIIDSYIRRPRNKANMVFFDRVEV